MRISSYGTRSRFRSQRFTGRRDLRRPVTGWRFWIPVWLIGLTSLVAVHNTRYAKEAAGEKQEVELFADEGGSSLRQLGFLSFGCLGVVFLRGGRPRHFKLSLLLLILAAGVWTAMSTLWSDDPHLTVRRSVIPLLVLVGSIGIALVWSPHDLCRAVTNLSCAFVVLGILAEIRYGTFLQGEYRFSGTLHPNDQAVNCGMLFLSSLALYRRRQRLETLCVAGFAAVFLYLTGCRGATIGLLMSAAMLWWLSSRFTSRFLLVACGSLVLSAFVFVDSLRPEPAIDLMQAARMGRQEDFADPTTLTGRLPIWQEAIGDINERPLFGYGYGAFWSQERVTYYSYIHDWVCTNSHSIYLETMLNIGSIGLLIVLVAVAVASYRGLNWFFERRDVSILFILALLAFGGISGISEAIFVRPGYPFMICLIGLCLIAVRHEREYAW